jgi:hypothetical protein
MNRAAIAVLKKDLRITRILWTPTAFSAAVFLLMAMNNPWIYLATGACLTFVAASVPLGIDDRYQTEPLFAALPGTRRSLVRGRYASWGLITAAGLAFLLAATALIQAGFRPRGLFLPSLLSVNSATAILAGTILAGLLFLPFHFRFGFWRGMWSFVGTAFVFSVLALNAIVLFAPAATPGAGRGAALPLPFRSTGRGLRFLAGLIDRYLDRPLIIAGTSIVLAILGLISYRMSVRFYEKRDL